MRPRLPPALFLAGPTAVGKSAIALALAERLQGEIVSVDSMQVYRGLDIGTAKPDAADRARVPHHLIDVADLSESFDAARFLRLATSAAADIVARGRRVIFCGGTGLYFKALLEGLDELPPADPALRAALEAAPLAALLEELAKRDPAAYARIDRENPRRIVRALEILRLTGRPLPAQRERSADPSRGVTPEPTVVVFARAPEDLRSRVEARVDAMFAAGLVDETRRLLRAGLGKNRTAMQALGYRQVAEHLEGVRDLPATMALVKQKTWQFARRQRTWFRHQLDARWIELDPGASPAAVALTLAG